MAGGEIYRVEIPIIVDDQTDKPLQQAEQKISKLEQHARKENERMRQHFMKIAKLQIDPIMKVRDNLTSGVLKADRLIRKLDTAQASPLIAVQDRVSAVVTRTNAMLDALDKGKVDVVAEMKGPLLDEIVKAKSALAVLDNVKAGPVAELRGELLGQLTKAMSQIRGLDLSKAEPQATLRERVTMKVREIGSSLRSLTIRAWDITLQVKDKATGVISSITSSARSIIDKLTSPLALLGAGAGIGAGIFFPLQLAGEFEQAQMSLDFYMGGVEEGKKAFEDLVRFAKETPFEFPFLQGAVIQLMGAGYDFEQAKRALLAFGDAAGRTGAGMQGIEAALLGFTQIASAGTLNLQDMKQVALNLKLPLNIFAKELGVAEDELGNIGSAGISSAKAMEAIVKTLEQRFAGGMKELSNSLLGMTAVIKDTAQLTVWHFGKGMAEPVKRILMDIIGLTEDTGGKFEEFQRKLEQLGETVGLKFEQVYNKIKEFWGEVSADPEFQKLSFGDKIIYVINRALNEINAWFDSEGGKKLQETFTKLGEIGAKAWIAGLKGAFRGAVSSAASGNLMGAVTMLGLTSMLGGGLVLRGALGLGKGIFGVGKWALGKLGLGSASAAAAGVAAETATATAATGAATAGAVGILGKALSTGGILAGVAGVLSGAYDIYRGYKEADYEEARKRYWAGGTKIGMVGTGAAIGTAIAPGIGTAVGAGIGGIAALLGGTAVSETLRNVWNGFLSYGSKALDTVATRASNTWNNITTWASGTWDSIKTGASNAGSWVAEKWNAAGDWISNKWSSFSEWFNTSVWTPVKDVGISAINIAAGAWSGVRDWVGEKWSDFSAWFDESIWTPVKDAAQAASQWVNERWYEVRTWIGDRWSDFSAWFEESIWTPVKTGAQAASQWVNERWNEAKTWVIETWGTVSTWFDETVWQPVKSAAQTAGAWLGEQFTAAKNSISEAWSGVSDWFSSNVWEPIKTGATEAWGWVREKLGDAGEWIGDKWQSFKDWLAGLGQKGSAVTGLKTSEGKATILEHATGGILTRPHLGLVAETGPEAIIPLSVGMRSRALGLWEEAGRRLGVRPYAKGRFAEAVPVAAPAMSGASRIGGLFGGQALADRVNEWIDGIDFGRLKTRAIKTWEDIRLSIAYTWERVKEIVSLETLTRGAAYLLGYLGSTIFSGWLEKWGNVKTWASGVLDDITARGKSIKESFQAGREARQAAAAHAVGGILTRPHLGMVAEAGPEAIIPLSARMRPRALELWQQTGELLGVTPRAGGDIFGNVLGGVRNVWDKTRALFKSDRVLSIANTTESAAIALESTRKGQELTTRSIKNYEKKLQKTRTIEEAEKVRAGIMGPSDKRQTIIKEFGSILGAIGTGVLVGAGTGMLVGAGVMSPVTAMLGTILGAGAGAFGGQAAASALYDHFSPHATGGILTRPHLGLVAEAGPEAIIPLSTRMRARALALYEETGRRLGVRPYEEGGFAGALTQNREQKIPVSFTPSFATLGPATINLNFDLTGLVRQVVIENREDIDSAVDKIADAIANNLRSVFQNMTK